MSMFGNIKEQAQDAVEVRDRKVQFLLISSSHDHVEVLLVMIFEHHESS